MLSKDYLLSLQNIHNDNIKLLHNLYDNKNILVNLICNDNFYNDIHIFNNNNIYDKINNNKSDLGSISLQYTLCNPKDDSILLKNNQIILEKFMSKNYEFNIINNNLNNILWFYKNRTDEEKVLLNNLNFSNKYLKIITNRYSFMIMYYVYRYYVSPVFVVVYPLLILIVPLIIMRLVLKVKIKFNVFYELVKRMYLPKLDKSEYARGSFGLYSMLIKQSLSCSAISLII